MTEEKLVEEILEIASELDRGDITFDEAQIKAQTLVRIDRYEQLIIPDVVKSLKDKQAMTFDEYKWKFFDRISDYKWSRKTDGYVHSKEDVYLEWRG